MFLCFRIYRTNFVFTGREWQATIFDHTGTRKTFILTADKLQSQKQTDLIKLRERINPNRAVLD